jgi:modulator of FtsH protease HflK
MQGSYLRSKAMNQYISRSSRQRWYSRLGAIFNLNDQRWGRGESSGSEGGKPEDTDKPVDPEQAPLPRPDAGKRPMGGGPSGPPDLDELWRDFNRKISGLFGGSKRHGGSGGGGSPDMRNAGWGLGLILVFVLGLIWLGTGFFIVQEGQQAVVTRFGQYKATVGAGFNWRLPYPFERHEMVFVTQIRSVDIGKDKILKATGLRDSAMLTEDENIVDIKFAVQYRLNDARAYLFESKSPEDAVVQAAESSVREVLGKMKMDAALSEERDQIAIRMRALMQNILDRYKVGIEIVAINLQQGGVRPPEQVQASFDDVLKAGQERERAKNEAQAYANDVIPRAVGAASRLKEEADAYKARVVAQAQGDAQRFRSVFAEYQKAPQVTRDRMYLDTMQQIYANATKVVVESKQGMLYLPLDKILQNTTQGKTVDGVSGTGEVGAAVSPPLAATGVTGAAGNDARARDTSRNRDRDVR